MAGQGRQGDSRITDEDAGENLALYLTKDKAGTLLILMQNSLAQARVHIVNLAKQIAISNESRKEVLREQQAGYKQLVKEGEVIYEEVEQLYQELDKPTPPQLIIKP